MRKKLSEITRTEWIGLQWVEDSEMGQEDRMFMAIGYRTPDEAAQARDDWDMTAADRDVARIELEGEAEGSAQ